MHSELFIDFTNQPHSEVAALGVLLNRLGIKTSFKKARLKIIPQERGKLMKS